MCSGLWNDIPNKYKQPLQVMPVAEENRKIKIQINKSNKDKIR